MSDLLKQLVEQDFGIEGRGKWYHAVEHDSLVVNAEDGTWFWNSRGLRGSLKEYLIDVRGYSYEQAQDFLKNYVGGFSNSPNTSVEVIPYERLVDLMWDNGKNKRAYWYDRRLRDETIDRYKLGHINGWNLIPLYKDGEFVDFQCRRDVPSKAITRWYRTGQVFLFNELILPFTKTIFITEGTVDAILLNQEGFPAISSNGADTWQHEWFSKFAHIRDIYYVEDNDRAGRIGARTVAKSLGIGRVKIVSYTGMEDKYDTVDFFRNGGTKETWKEWVDNNSKYLFELEVVYGRKSEIGKPKWNLR